MDHSRIIGEYTGDLRGPLLIAFGGIHGNEPAGVHALELLFKMLEVEPITNPNFEFKGRFIGILGNQKAMETGDRYIDKDLNRIWTREHIHRIMNSPEQLLENEDYELRQIWSLVRNEISTYQPEKVVLLDLHTTSSYGGIFTLVQDDPESLRIGVELHAPVVRGMMEGIHGTTMHFFNTDTLGVETYAVTFESGQHDEPLSINRAIAATINCMRTVGCVREGDVENRHDEILIEFSRTLPKVADLQYAFPIDPQDEFVMYPGYKNFQPVREGDLLAQNRHGEVIAEAEGLLLMPLYQKQGDDGFFIIRRSSNLKILSQETPSNAHQRAANR